MNWPSESTRKCRGTRHRREFFVAPGSYSKWSGTLPEANAEGSDGPFPSIERARDYLRAHPSPGPVTVWLREGTYQLDEPLRFGPEDTLPVTWAAWPNEKVVISGGMHLTGWRECERNGRRTWVHPLPPELRGCRQLFVDGRRATVPTLPREGCYVMADVPGVSLEGFMSGEPGDRFYAAPGDFAAFANLHDVDVVAYHFWTEERLPVRSFDPATGLVTCGRTSVWPLQDDAVASYARYRIEHVREALDTPGQWYRDRDAGELLYLPLPDEDLATTDLRVPRLGQLLLVDGDAAGGRPAGNLCFRGISFAHSEWRHHPEAGSDRQAAISVPAAVEVAEATNCSFEDCSFTHLGGYGLELGPGSVACRVQGCTFADCGGGGIKAIGVEVDGEPYLANHAHVIADNEICDCGLVFASAVGVLLVHTWDVEVSHNHIHHLEYSGISCGWIWGYGPSATRDVLIARNHIHHLGSGLLNDMGGIYTLGVQPGTVLRGNRIHDIRMHNYGGWAIYADEGSSHLVVEDNVCYNTDSEAFQLHYGRENQVRNNIFALSELGQVSLTAFERERSLTFAYNIVITDGRPVFTARDGEDLAKPGIVSDCNCLWDLAGAVFSANQRRDRTGATAYSRRLDLAAMRERGYDLHSLDADPGCADPAGGDFTLPPDSPAYALGFRPFDQTAVGPRPPADRV